MYTSVRSQTAANSLPLSYSLESGKLGERYIKWFPLVLAGYACLGRGFAYVGIPPLYVGEISLLVGLFVMARTRMLPRILYLAPVNWLLVLMAWGSLRTIPYVLTYGIDAFRDAVLWGYGVFAFIVAAVLIENPVRLRKLLIRYRKFVYGFLIMALFFFGVKRAGFYSILPTIPGTHDPIGIGKGGDVMVHLAGAAALVLVGMVRANPLVYGLVGLNFFLGASVNRGGMLSFCFAMFLVLIFKNHRMKIAGLVFGGVFLLTLFALIGPSIDTGTAVKREVSVEQLFYNIKSIFSETDLHLDQTKEWRLTWWKEIANYTFSGPYLLTGKGFGVNLAEADGFGSVQKAGLRSPHNATLNMLGRSGLPGLFLWLAAHFAWFFSMMGACLKARREGDLAWHGIFLFLFAYASAFLINSSFDVFLEGPMGGIWYWSVYGVGLAALYIYKYSPEVAWD